MKRRMLVEVYVDLGVVWDRSGNPMGLSIANGFGVAFRMSFKGYIFFWVLYDVVFFSPHLGVRLFFIYHKLCSVVHYPSGKEMFIQKNIYTNINATFTLNSVIGSKGYPAGGECQLRKKRFSI